MDVHKLGAGHGYLVAGQVVLSEPGSPCLRCMGTVTEAALAEESSKYGAAGGRPQVVWSNGVLVSLAVGLVVQMVTPWSRRAKPGAYLSYDGKFRLGHRGRTISVLVGLLHALPECGRRRHDLRYPEVHGQRPAGLPMGGADHALGPRVDEHRHLSERCVTPGLHLPIFLGKTHLGAPSFGRVRSLNEWKIQAGDLGHRLAGDRLQVSNHSDGRLDDGEYQRFALSPIAGSRTCVPYRGRPACR
jgi:hypothetical protein